jgi:hypothetical protein
MFLLIVGLAIGIFVGYKFPEQVEQAINSVKKLIGDLTGKAKK